MAVDVYRLRQQPAAADPLREPAAHAGGVDAGDDPLLDVPGDVGMALVERGSGEGQVADTEAGDLLEHREDHLVALAEVVVEGDRVAVLET